MAVRLTGALRQTAEPQALGFTLSIEINFDGISI